MLIFLRGVGEPSSFPGCYDLFALSESRLLAGAAVSTIFCLSSTETILCHHLFSSIIRLDRVLGEDGSLLS